MRSNNFTLVELLTVIAIIAILAGILIPTINKSMARAEATQCINNLGQLAKADMAYSVDHKQRFAKHDTTDILKNTWLPLLYDYIKDAKVLSCPSDEKNANWLKETNGELAVASSNAPFNMSYIANANLFNTNPPKRYACEKPSGVATFGPGTNCKNNVAITFVAGTGVGSTEDQFDLERHGEGANYAFADGHVATITKTDFKAGKFWTLNGY